MDESNNLSEKNDEFSLSDDTFLETFGFKMEPPDCDKAPDIPDVDDEEQSVYEVKNVNDGFDEDGGEFIQGC